MLSIGIAAVQYIEGSTGETFENKFRALLPLIDASSVQPPDCAHLPQYLLISGVELVVVPLRTNIANTILHLPFPALCICKLGDRQHRSSDPRKPTLHLIAGPSDPSSENRRSASKGGGTSDRASINWRAEQEMRVAASWTC